MTDLWNAYAEAAKAAGCPPDQFKNFARAGIVLNPTQLRFSAAAREADKPDGPIEIGFGGARGGGKSHGLIAQLGADDCQRFPGLKVLLLRKAAKSNLENFQDLRMKIFGNIPHIFAKMTKTVYFQSVKPNSRIILGHFQNERDIDNYLGLEYDVIALEEATTLSPAKIKQIQTCCRTSKPGWRPRMYSNTNPGGVGHAFYRARFILPYRTRQETTTRFVPSLPTDCPQINEDYLRVLDGMTGWQKRAWRYGDWDIAAGQFFTNFRHDIHVEEHFDPAKAKEWLLSFDYGFRHYTAVYLGAVCDDGLHIVDEHCHRLMLPRQHADGIKAMLDRHKITPERSLALSDIRSIVAGTDAFAKERDGKSVADDYATHGIRFTPANTERINGWAAVVNALGDADAKPPIAPKLFIHRRCARLIDTIPIMEHDPNRPEDVLKIDTDDDGVGGDDACLIAGTMIECKTGKRPIQEIEQGEYVMTRAGWRKVTASGLTNISAEVITVKLANGASITATPSHPVWCKGAWKRLADIRIGDDIEICQTSSIQQQSSQNTTESISTDDHTARKGRGGPTLGLAVTTQDSELSHCTGKYGSVNMEQFQKVSTSTIKTVTAQTTGLKTLNVYPHQVIRKSTRQSSLKEAKFGGKRKMENYSIRNTAKQTSPNISQSKRNVQSVKLDSQTKEWAGVQSIVQLPVKTKDNDRIQETANSGLALGVITDSVVSNTIQLELVPCRVLKISDGKRSRVYNLTVEEHPEFFANGVLVHNCDSLRYMVATKAKQSRMMKIQGL